MNPMFQAALQSILTHFLTLGAGYLISRGIWTREEAQMYVAGATVAIIGFAWAQWKTYKERRKLVTALATPEVKSEREIAIMAKTVDQRPPVTIHQSRVPYPVGESRPMGGQERESDLPPAA